jgi:hypothetical protein
MKTNYLDKNPIVYFIVDLKRILQITHSPIYGLIYYHRLFHGHAYGFKVYLIYDPLLALAALAGYPTALYTVFSRHPPRLCASQPSVSMRIAVCIRITLYKPTHGFKKTRVSSICTPPIANTRTPT